MCLHIEGVDWTVISPSDADRVKLLIDAICRGKGRAGILEFGECVVVQKEPASAAHCGTVPSDHIALVINALSYRVSDSAGVVNRLVGSITVQNEAVRF